VQELPSGGSTAVDTVAPADANARWNIWLLLVVVLLGLIALYGLQLIVGLADMVAFMGRHYAYATSPVFVNKIRNYDPATVNQVFSAGSLAFAVAIAELAMAAIGYLLARSFFGATNAQLGLGLRLSPALIGLGIIAGAALWFVSAIVGGAQAKIFGEHPQMVEQIFQLHKDAWSITYDFLGACVVAPICEEFFFRGIIFTGLAQRLPLVWAAIISGVVFAGAHADLWALVPLSAIGVGLAYLYHRTKSLWPNIIAHFTVNTTSLFLIHAFPQLAK